MTWVTTENFLDHFGLESLDDLPGTEELKASGLLDARPAAAGFKETDPLSDEAEAAQEAGTDDEMDESGAADDDEDGNDADERARGNVEPLFPDEKA